MARLFFVGRPILDGKQWWLCEPKHCFSGDNRTPGTSLPFVEMNVFSPFRLVL